MKNSKKIIPTLLIAIAMLSSSALASDNTKSKDCVMMKDGKMVVTKDGSPMAMTDDMTMRDGCRVKTDGTVISADGKKMMLKDGDAITMDGEITKEATAADNTARNVRDRDNRTLTPLDQGNSKADVETTARIRKDILAHKGLSINASNVKIITLDGHVTLRGPVGTAEEKRLIGEIAINIAPKVENQLEVK